MILKQFLVTWGSYESTDTIILRDVGKEEPLTPELARHVAIKSRGHTNGVQVSSNDFYGYLLEGEQVTKVDYN